MLNHVFRTDIFWFDRFLVGLMEGGVVRPCCKPPHPPTPILLYITSRFAYMKHLFLLTTHGNFAVLNFKLRVQTNYPLAWMLFFCIATAFPTSSRMKTVCFCWVWKLSNDACPCNLFPSASFLTQSNWLKKKANQSPISLCLERSPGNEVDAH